TLTWSSNLTRFLEPDNPIVCYVYDDEISSQTNDFEADTIASLIWLVQGNLSERLIGERQPDGTLSTPSNVAYQGNEFWTKAVGVVTPHRAQMARIIARLEAVLKILAQPFQ